jgi:hypothetical protein
VHLAGPVLLKGGPVLLSAKITYIEFEFDPVASQQGRPSLTKSKPIIVCVICETSFFQQTTTTHGGEQST